MKIVERLKEYLRTLTSQNNELLWAKIWDDTKHNIGWIEDLPGVSPGRWAVGYNYLYVMTRILNEKEPQAVLEMGLGISSTLISQYFNYSKDNGIHDVIEQDAEWASFYSKKHKLSNQTNISVVDICEKDYKGIKYNAYENIAPIVSKKRYDLISVDGPWGSEKHSRRDIVDYIPEILADSYIIIFDDSNRKGEQNTIDEIKRKLDEYNISHVEGTYPGMSDCTIITSPDNRFLCSL